MDVDERNDSMVEAGAPVAPDAWGDVTVDRPALPPAPSNEHTLPLEDAAVIGEDCSRPPQSLIEPGGGEVEPLRLPGLEDVPVGPRDADMMRSMLRQQAFEKCIPSEWRERYFDLMARFGRWDVAAFVLWFSLPTAHRRPKTQEEFATQVLGLGGDKLLTEWKKLAGVEDEIRATRLSALFHYVPDSFEALGELATTADYRNVPAIRLLLEITGYYTPKADMTLGVPKWVKDQAAQLAGQEPEQLEDIAQIPAEE